MPSPKTLLKNSLRTGLAFTALACLQTHAKAAETCETDPVQKQYQSCLSTYWPGQDYEEITRSCTEFAERLQECILWRQKNFAQEVTSIEDETLRCVQMEQQRQQQMQ